MKIAILTLPLHANYGGVLQAYALQNALKKMGHDVWLINIQKDEKSVSLRWIIKNPKRYITNLINPKVKLELIKDKKKIGEEISLFTENYIVPKTKVLHKISGWDLEKSYDFDAYIVGSDQVWRPKYTLNIYDYYLKFLNKKAAALRISYAPSFGTNDWEYSKIQTKVCKNLLKRFDAVSVREDSAIDIVKNKFGVDAEHVLDPTFLLNTSDYIDLFNNSKSKISQGDLLVYILDNTEEKNRLVNVVSKNMNYTPFFINTRNENCNLTIQTNIKPSMESWIRGFYDAKYVIADSFHACVFAILFNKPFIIFGNKNRGLARFSSVLRMFQLENRYIESISDFNLELLNQPIDWISVNNILNLQKIKSISFLKIALGELTLDDV